MTELQLTIALAAKLSDSSFISQLAELFPSLKDLSFLNPPGRRCAKNVVRTLILQSSSRDVRAIHDLADLLGALQAGSADGFESYKNLELVYFGAKPGDNAFLDEPCAFRSLFEGRISPELVAAVKLDRFRRRAEEIGMLAIAKSCPTLKRIGADQPIWDVIRARVEDEGEEEVRLEPRDVDSIVWE